MLMGVWIMLLPFLGFPSSWGKIIALVSGLIVIILAYALRSPVPSNPSEHMPYVEHRAEPGKDIIPPPPSQPNS